MDAPNTTQLPVSSAGLPVQSAATYKQYLFIFDHREMTVLVLLGILVAVFSFTGGVHFAKRLTNYSIEASAPKTHEVQAVADQVPNQLDLVEQGKRVNETVDQTLQQTLHDEVARTGIKLQTGHQVELPDTAKTKEAGATTLKNHPIIDVDSVH